MTETPPDPQRHDRLTAFLHAFGLRARMSADPARDPSANLFVLGEAQRREPTHIVFRVLSGPPEASGAAILGGATVDFGGAANPLVGALPTEIVLGFEDMPSLRGLAELIVAEGAAPRCGGPSVQDRLCEVVVVLAVRRAIARGTVHAGLLAGLAHPTLHPCLVALHDDPARAWRVDALAAIAGLSRSHFNGAFAKTVGTTPAAYLTSWRLALGRTEIAAGHSVKAVAKRVGFGSAAAFSRAFSRRYGHPPMATGRGGASDIAPGSRSTSWKPGMPFSLPERRGPEAG